MHLKDLSARAEAELMASAAETENKLRQTAAQLDEHRTPHDTLSLRIRRLEVDLEASCQEVCRKGAMI